jgi:hypothetical protein
MNGEAELIDRARTGAAAACDGRSPSSPPSAATPGWQRLAIPMVLRMAIVGPAVVFVIAAGQTVPGIEVALRPMPVALASLVDLDWPRWIHNLADLLQIVTLLVAILAWGSARRRRPPSTGSSSKVDSSTPD